MSSPETRSTVGALPCPMHIVAYKDGNGRYRSPTVSRPYRAIVVRRRLRSRSTRIQLDPSQNVDYRIGTCSRLVAHVDYERAESTC